MALLTTGRPTAKEAAMAAVKADAALDDLLVKTTFNFTRRGLKSLHVLAAQRGTTMSMLVADALRQVHGVEIRPTAGRDGR